jgi:metal-responsive CopG/Arc/MetJ family transcriptional regulator
MNYCSVSVDGDLLEAVENRTDDLDHRDDWIEDAVEQYLDNADELPDRPDLDRDEFRQLVVNRAIERKLVC